MNLAPPMPRAGKVKNTIYRLVGEPETYLVVPMATQKARGYQSLCAVVVRGDAAAAAATLFPDPSKVGSMFTVSHPGGVRGNIPYKSAVVGDRMMVVAQSDGWTLISSGADERPARLRRQ